MCNYKRHIHTCPNTTNLHYKSGFHTNPKTVVQQLDGFGVVVPSDKRLYRYFICYDSEATLEKTHPGHAEKIKWTHTHHAISVAVNSNVPGYESPVCFVNPDLKVLTHSKVDYLHEIQSKAFMLCKENWTDALDQLEELRKKWYIDPLTIGKKSRNRKKSQKDNEEITNVVLSEAEDDQSDYTGDHLEANLFEEEEDWDLLQEDNEVIPPLTTDIYEEIEMETEGDDNHINPGALKMHRLL